MACPCPKSHSSCWGEDSSPACLVLEPGCVMPLTPDYVGEHISKAGCWRASRRSTLELDESHSQVLWTTRKMSPSVSGPFAPFHIFSLRGSFCYKTVPFLRLSTASSLVRNVLERMLIRRTLVRRTTSPSTSTFITLGANVYHVLTTKLQELYNISSDSFDKALRLGLRVSPCYR